MLHFASELREISYFLHGSYIAVDFFFILSGFVVSHAYGSKLMSSMSKSDYVIRRAARLYPVMSVGLLIGLPAFALYSSAGLANYSLRELLAATLGNLFFIPYIGATASGHLLFPDRRSALVDLLRDVRQRRLFEFSSAPIAGH